MELLRYGNDDLHGRPDGLYRCGDMEHERRDICRIDHCTDDRKCLLPGGRCERSRYGRHTRQLSSDPAGRRGNTYTYASTCDTYTKPDAACVAYA